MNPSIAVLLAVYTATSGMRANVTLEVTFTTTPDRCSRNWGNTACVIAITPKVLVSNSWRAVAIGVASNAPMAPMPALLTSTSMGPLASSAAAIDSGFVTSSASTRSRGDWGRTPSRGVRMVATTFQPCEWKWRAVSSPYPEEQPVISTVFISTPVGGPPWAPGRVCRSDHSREKQDCLSCRVRDSFASVQK